MEIPVPYIGFAQAIFIAVLIFLKNPLKIADRILAVFMIFISWMFALNIIQDLNGLTKETWIYSLSISITYPAFLLLYSKYVTIDFDRFQRMDYLHALPFLVTLFLVFLFRNPENSRFYFDIDHYEQMTWLRNWIGFLFILLLWVYGFLALRKIIHYRKQRANLYSYRSERISLNWLFVLVISFFLIQNVIILGSTLRELEIVSFEMQSISNWSYLFFVYVAGIWGLRQSQLTSEIKPFQASPVNLEEESTSEKYQKSGIKSEQASNYLKILTRYMEETQAWKDTELSVSKISEETQIPKHHITQALNEHLGKNFYGFVNEYRLIEAKKMISSPKFSAWSFVAIAHESGFNSKTAFNNFFKKSTGLTPSEYKDKISF